MREALRFLRECLEDRERAWTARQVSETLKGELGVEVTAEAIHLRAKESGFCWDRRKARYERCG